MKVYHDDARCGYCALSIIVDLALRTTDCAGPFGQWFRPDSIVFELRGHYTEDDEFIDPYLVVVKKALSDTCDKTGCDLDLASFHTTLLYTDPNLVSRRWDALTFTMEPWVLTAFKSRMRYRRWRRWTEAKSERMNTEKVLDYSPRRIGFGGRSGFATFRGACSSGGRWLRGIKCSHALVRI